MGFESLSSFMSEMAYFVVVFGIVLFIGMVRGYRPLYELILGLYLALLLYFHFPNLDKILEHFSGAVLAIFQLSLFILITFFTTALCDKILPDYRKEGKFDKMGKKLLLTLGATILILVFSFQVLPISQFVATGTPLQALFGAESSFFWWLLVPFVILYIV
jgi:hypothetical protein